MAACALAVSEDASCSAFCAATRSDLAKNHVLGQLDLSSVASTSPFCTLSPTLTFTAVHDAADLPTESGALNGAHGAGGADRSSQFAALHRRGLKGGAGIRPAAGAQSHKDTLR